MHPWGEKKLTIRANRIKRGRYLAAAVLRIRKEQRETGEEILWQQSQSVGDGP
jgi:hypothetical protein